MFPLTPDALRGQLLVLAFIFPMFAPFATAAIMSAGNGFSPVTVAPARRAD
ncbi:hypothetical protein KTD31_03020 [Burkholderia multivorans]|uniref:hypothetical protein n=1 Tax=Burkholderia multivorans TaxID=87883 RepID=UPI001C22FEC5|nr:hypothetical protein [Burkholderia multivorans]MBU9200324.1 hypothetical protein [Burkholderia multivorans]MDN8078550.1 hypothetical protein [Burkholderia multivorans]